MPVHIPSSSSASSSSGDNSSSPFAGRRDGLQRGPRRPARGRSVSKLKTSPPPAYQLSKASSFKIPDSFWDRLTSLNQSHLTRLALTIVVVALALLLALSLPVGLMRSTLGMFSSDTQASMQLGLAVAAHFFSITTILSIATVILEASEEKPKGFVDQAKMSFFLLKYLWDGNAEAYIKINPT